jgi:hypothetical protein
MIAMLDEIDEDENLEPSVSACGYIVLDDREGGDVCDEPQDAANEVSDEPSPRAAID